MKQNTKKTLAYFLKASLRYKVSGFLMLFAVISASLTGVIIPLFYKKFFDILAQTKESQGLIKNLTIIVALNLAGWVFWRVTFFCVVQFQTKVLANLSNRSFEYLHKHSFSFFENNFVGSLVKRVKWFSKAFEVIADQITWSLLPLAVNIVVVTFVLFKRNFVLGVAVSLWTALFLLTNFFFSKYKFKYDVKRAAKETETTAILADTITNQKTVKLFNGYSSEVANFAKETDNLRKISKFTWNLSGFMDGFQGFFMIFLEGAVMFMAIKLWAKGALTIGDFALIQAYLISIFHRVWDFGKVLRRIYEALADAEEMTVILETPFEITDSPKAKKIIVAKGKVEFRNVDFYYNQTRKILGNFNLNIRPKEKIALVGPSGAGKTTVAKLLLRMHDVADGEILIDGQNIAKITQESLWQNISLVPQDPILFHRTLMENIKYGSQKATDKQVIDAAKKAYCHDFIEQLPEKYQTFVGERGIKLSGGERQRVAIARAILRNSPILVLDEATSSLDSAAEKLIQQAMDKLMEQKTVIIIAHRLSTIKKMDRIIVIEEGEITEQGAHTQLIEKPNGKYRKLWEIQAGNFT